MKTAACLALLLLSATAAADSNPAQDWAMGFVLGLESEIGQPYECIGEATSLSASCKKLDLESEESAKTCFAAIADLMDKCGLKQQTLGRVQEMVEEPARYFEARAALLLKSPELAQDLAQAKSQCAAKQYSECGVFVGKFVGLLTEAPAAGDLPASASDGQWLLYLLLGFVACALAGAIWRLCASTGAFLGDVCVPLCKLLLILALWIFVILFINKLNLAAYDVSTLGGDVAADVAKVVRDAAAPLDA